ncbi:hypothetical protein [Mycolicibacterium sp. XJ1819]
MSQIGASLATDTTVGHADDEITAQSPISVYSCTRLGRVANPPSFSFADWFRSARRR